MWGGDRMFVPLVGNGDINVLLPQAQSGQPSCRREIIYKSPLKPPIKKGDAVATLRVTTAVAGRERGAAPRGRGRAGGRRDAPRP